MAAFAATWTLFNAAVLIPVTNHLTGTRQNVSSFTQLHGNLRLLVVYLVASWVLAAFCEETAFRGYLLTRLTDVLGRGRRHVAVAVLGSSLLFGLLHRAGPCRRRRRPRRHRVQRASPPVPHVVGAGARARLRRHPGVHLVLLLRAVLRPVVGSGRNRGVNRDGEDQRRITRPWTRPHVLAAASDEGPDGSDRPRRRARRLLASTAPLPLRDYPGASVAWTRKQQPGSGPSSSLGPEPSMSSTQMRTSGATSAGSPSWAPQAIVTPRETERRTQRMCGCGAVPPRCQTAVPGSVV